MMSPWESFVWQRELLPAADGPRDCLVREEKRAHVRLRRTRGSMNKSSFLPTYCYNKGTSRTMTLHTDLLPHLQLE